MKKFLLACIAIGSVFAIVVSAMHSAAHAQDATKFCDSECLLKQIDALDQKVDALAIEANKSIKSGQKIILHTDPSIRGGGCLTPNGPSGDLGGFVEWSVNCSQGISWVIK